MEKLKETQKLVGALLLGAAVGGAFGILFAPNKGRKIRRDISNKSEDLSISMKEKIDKFRKNSRNEVEMARDKVNSFISKAERS